MNCEHLIDLIEGRSYSCDFIVKKIRVDPTLPVIFTTF